MSAARDPRSATTWRCGGRVGYRLDEDGRLLARFVSHLDGRRHRHGHRCRGGRVGGGDPAGRQRGRRLTAIRGFARYLQALDPAHEVPPAWRAAGTRVRRPFPHLYSEDDITALMAAAQALQPAPWAATVETIIGLLWATGMRIGEVLRLNVADFDPDDRRVDGVAVEVRQVPPRPARASRSARSSRYRRQLATATDGPALFVGARPGDGLSYSRFNRDFAEFAGLDRGSPPRRAPSTRVTTCATASL